MADPTQWGSIVWKIVHIQSEHLGKQTLLMLQKDELLLIHKLLKQIYFILPCSICKKHYNEYLNKSNYKDIIYKDINTYIINYFYNLHNSVNERNNRELFKKEDLIVYKEYTRQQYTSVLKEFEQLFKKVYSIHYYVSIDAINDFMITINKLRKLTNF